MPERTQGTVSHTPQGSEPSSQGRLHAVQEYAGRGREQMNELVGEHPVSTVLTVFGVGFGLGLVLGAILAHEPEPSGFERWKRTARRSADRWGRDAGKWGRQTSRTASRWSDDVSSTAETIGHQVMDAIASALPRSVSKYL